MAYASQLLKQCLQRYPQGALFLFLEARLLQVTGRVDEVCDSPVCYFNLSINQSEHIYIANESVTQSVSQSIIVKFSV